MNNLKKLTAKESNALFALIDKQIKEREASKAYQPVGVLDDNFTVAEIEAGAFGPVIKLDNDRTAFPHRSLQNVAVGTVCELVWLQCPEDKTLEINGQKRTIKKGATKIVAYPVE